MFTELYSRRFVHFMEILLPLTKGYPYFLTSGKTNNSSEQTEDAHAPPLALILRPPAPTSVAHEAADTLPLLQALAQEEAAGGGQVPQTAVRQPQRQQHPLLLLVHVGHLSNDRLPLDKVVTCGGHKLVTHDLKGKSGHKMKKGKDVSIKTTHLKHPERSV